MSKKILMINGSARKKDTYGMLLQISEALKAHGIEAEIVNLFDYNIKDCVGCMKCARSKDCSQKDADDMHSLMQKMAEADGFVFSSPVYLANVTSKFKAFADRTYEWFFRPETAGKPSLFVTSTMSTGIKDTIKFMDTYATGIGARKSGSVTRTAKTLAAQVSEKELAKFIKNINGDKKNYKPSMNELIIFEVQKVLALKGGESKDYWERNNWIDGIYYYKCKINPCKRLFAGFMFKILSKAMA